MREILKENKCSKQEAYDILHKYIKEQIDLTERKEISEELFSLPNWELHQAYIMGLKKAYRKLQEFIPSDQEK